MELTTEHLEVLRKIAEEIDHGSVTLIINGGQLDIVAEKRIRIQKEPSTEKPPRTRIARQVQKKT